MVPLSFLGHSMLDVWVFGFWYCFFHSSLITIGTNKAKWDPANQNNVFYTPLSV